MGDDFDTPFRRDPETWLAYGMLGFYNFLLSGLGPLMPSLREELGLSYTVASLHFSAFAAGMIAAGLVGERVVGQWGRKTTFWTGAAGLAIGALGLCLVRQPVLTMASVLVMGAVGSLTLVLIPAILADRHGGRRAIAIVEANILSAATGAMAGVLIGLAEWSSVGWRGALLLSLLAPLVLVRRYRGVPLEGTRRRAEIGQAGAGHLPVAYWAYWATVVLSVGVEFSLIFWGADFLGEVGLSEGAAATTVSLFLWGMVAGRMAGRQIARQIATTRLLPLALAVSGAGFLVFWLAPVAFVAVVGLFIAGFGVANLYPLTVSLALGTASDRSDEAGARLSLASGTAILVAPFLLGALADAVGIRAAYTVVPVFLACALVASRLGQRFAEVQVGASPVREAR